MAAPPVPRLRRPLGRSILGLAPLLAAGLLVVGLLAAGARNVEAASVAWPVPAATAATAPGYTLDGFRWNRTSVPVYYNWEGGACVFNKYDFTGVATTIPPQILLDNLQASIDEINAHLRGGLTLQLVGPATRAELCSTNSARPLVVGFGTMASAATVGQALSFGIITPGGYTSFTAARVFLTNQYSFTCAGAPTYNDLQHTMTHEMLHAVGIAHSAVASAIMRPSFVPCRAPYTLQPDDIAAINQIYPPTLPLAASAAAVASPGTFASAVVFAPSGQALVVFTGGSPEQIEAAARAVGATGVWVQDGAGTFRLVVVNGPTFLRDQFRAAFPIGLSGNVAVTIVR